MRIYLYINIIILLIFNTLSAKNNIEPKNYNELVNLFKEWRSFENPPLMNGAPDYTQRRFNSDKQEFRDLRDRLGDIDTTDWPIYHQADWHIVRAEMNGYDFNQRVLRPWVRDPAFYQTVWMYQSDVPAHEGPTNHGTLEFWTYEFPLDDLSSNKLATQLGMIPHFLFQAKGNLTGDARDLWVAGIENFKEQKANLDEIKSKIVKHHGESHDGLLKKPLENAVAANDDFIKWLNLKSPTKNGPSGIGKDDYSWYQKNVHLVPLTWEEEVSLLQRELDRAWSSLKMEEHLNRNLPPMVSAKTEQEFDIMKEKGVRRLMDFLSDHDIMHMKDNMEPALREQMGKFVPEEDRNFFYIGMHYDPVPLYSHFYHWFDLAQVRDDPHKSPIRRGPLLYNMFDSKSEGIATGVEEIFMQLGLYEDSPRSKEIVWILLAQRAARGLGSLYAHANMMTMEEAGKVHVKWTPRKWMEREPHLLRFEQHLYLRQPGYGTCYITGKYLIERLITKRAEQLESQGKKFSIKEFLKDYNDAGNIPVGLIEWEMIGQNKK